MKDAPSIFKEALQLPPDQRERLMLDLLDSLGHEGPPGVLTEEALAARIEERVADLDAGRARLLDADEALARGRANLRRRSPP